MTASFVLLSDETLAAPAASMTATVDTAYRMFRVTFFGIKDGTPGYGIIRLNSDAGNNYIYQRISADNTTVAGVRGSANAALRPMSAFDIAANGTQMWTCDIEKPLATTPARATSSGSIFGDLATDAICYESATNEWANTADLIDEITVLASAGDFAIGSRMLVEGVEP